MSTSTLTQIRDLYLKEDPSLLQSLSTEELNEIEQTLFAIAQKVDDEREKRDVQPMIQTHIAGIVEYLFAHDDVVLHVLYGESVALYRYEPVRGYVQRTTDDAVWEPIMHDDLLEVLEETSHMMMDGDVPSLLVLDRVPTEE